MKECNFTLLMSFERAFFNRLVFSTKLIATCSSYLPLFKFLTASVTIISPVNEVLPVVSRCVLFAELASISQRKRIV